MTETTFPFADDSQAPAEEKGRNKKAMLLAGGVAALLLLGGGGYVLTSGGGGDEEAFTPPKRAPRAAVAAKAAPAKPVTKAVAKLPAAFDVPLGKDPFKVLYVEPEAAQGGGGAPANGAPVPVAPAPVAPADAPKAAYPLKLKAISTPQGDAARVYTFVIDGVDVRVVPAQRFGKYGELIVLGFTRDAKGKTTGAVVQVGDDSPLELGIGKTEAVL